MSFKLGKTTKTKGRGITSLTLNAEYVVIFFEKQILDSENIVEAISVSYMEYPLLPLFPEEVFYFMAHDLIFIYVNGALTKITINDDMYHYRELHDVYGTMKDALAVGDVLFDKIGKYIPI
jgi:hypothetical protein